MPILDPNAAFEKFSRMGRNSSHFIWLLDQMSVFEARNGWVFGFTQVGSVTLLALEPLIPQTPTSYTSEHLDQFQKAWSEFQSEIQPKIVAFVSVYSPFAELLRSQGFQILKIGHEPWMRLENCIPRGNAGKGVRSARNQALRSGLSVEEWPATKLAPSTPEHREISKLFKDWNKSRILHLTGFMNATDPFKHSHCRRYFVVRNEVRQIEGYLIATPIPGIKSYFLEDLVIRRNAPKGAGELLTLEAMIALRDSGFQYASLGVVSVIGAGKDLNSDATLPPLVRFLVVTFPHLGRRFYNFDGLETFRKRFNPEKWENVFLCVQNQPSSKVSDTRAWFQVLLALLWAFRPRVSFSWTWLKQRLLRPFQKNPVTWTVGLVSFALFAGINHFGTLPTWAIDRFAFAGDTPFIEWIYRSIISDFLYFDRSHFVFCAVPLLALIYWAEKTHLRRFIITFVMLVSVLDDFLNYAVIIKPFHYFQPKMFEHLISVDDVGGSLWLANLLGLQLCKLKKNREILFASICLISVFGFVFSSDHLKTLVLNLNHFLFLTIGYITGKVLFEFERRQSRAVAKGKPPAAKCVLPNDAPRRTHSVETPLTQD